MRIVIFAFCVLSALAVAGIVRADDECTGSNPRAVVAHVFAVADLDADGSLTREEYAAAGLERYGVSFEASDADSDGRTSLAEYLALYDRYHPAGDGLEA